MCRVRLLFGRPSAKAFESVGRFGFFLLVEVGWFAGCRVEEELGVGFLVLVVGVDIFFERGRHD